jgi:hypothetical protein
VIFGQQLRALASAPVRTLRWMPYYRGKPDEELTGNRQDLVSNACHPAHK